MKKIIKSLLIISNIKKKFLIFSVAGILTISLLEVLSIAIIYPAMQFYFNDNNLLSNFIIFTNLDFNKKLLLFITIIILVFLIKNIIILVFNYIYKKELYLRQWKLTNKIYKIYLYNNLSINSDLSKVNNTLIYSGTVARWISDIFVFFSELAILIFITFFLILNNYKSSFFVLTLFSILALYNYFFKSIIKTWGKTNVANIYKATKDQIEAFSGLREITVMNNQSFFSNRFSKNTYEYCNIFFKVNMTDLIPKFFLEIIVVLFFLIGLYFLSTYSKSAFLEILPELGLYLISLLRIIPCIIKLSSITNNLNFVKEPIEELKNILNYKVNLFQDKKIINSFKTIEFENVKFYYKKNIKNFIKINLKLKKNKFYGIIGKSGSGKTTLTNLLLGILDPTSGKIKIDKTNIKYCKSSWLKQCGLVAQDVFIINDSLCRNVALGLNENDTINLKRVYDCLKLAELNEFIGPKNKIKDIIIDENAKNISSGQRQRIGIARALYKDPSVIILDEPTSSLDEVTSRKFFNSIDKIKKNKLLIVCTHDYSNLKNCNQIINISKNKADLFSRNRTKKIISFKQY